MSQIQTQSSPTPYQLLDTQFMERKAEFQAVLPNNCTFERFTRIIKLATIQNPDLLTADRASLFISCFKTAQDGLLPDGRESALVVFYNNKQNKKMVQYMPMLAGILKKIRNSGELSSLYAHIVYDADEFDYVLGDNESILHRPFMDKDKGKIIAVYAVAHTKDGAIYREVMSIAEIEKVRNFSKSKDGEAWKSHWTEMAKKTVIRRLAKRLPMSTDLEQIIQRDDEVFNHDKQIKQSDTVYAIENINKQVDELI